MNKNAQIILLLIFGAIAAFALAPIEVECGVPGAVCATKQSDGRIAVYYQVEPGAVYAIEYIAKKDFPYTYSVGSRIYPASSGITPVPTGSTTPTLSVTSSVTPTATPTKTPDAILPSLR